MKKTAILIMIITIFSKILGFGREVTLSYFYGASNVSDAYLIALTIPSVIFSFIGTGISTGYIPMYSKIENSFGVKISNNYTNNLINILLIFCTVIIILGLIFTEQIVRIFAAGFTDETFVLAVKFTRLSLLGIYFTGLINIFSGFLQLKGNYVIPASIGFPLNFCIIISILISYKTSNVILALGSVIASVSQFVLLVPFIFKNGYRYKVIINFKDEYLKKMIYIAFPVIIGVSVTQINVLIDRTLASTIAVGGISALNYANRLNGFVQGLFVLSISTVMFPIISKMAAKKDIIGLKRTLSEAINGINLLVIPATVGAMLFAKPIVKLLFGRGAFDESAVEMTSYALFFYSLGMIGYGLREVLSRAFYSLQDTKTPMINAAVAMGLNIVLNIIFSKFLGLGGLALATSISAIFCTFLLFISLRRKIGHFGLKKITISFIKILIVSLVMGVIAKISFETMYNSLGENLSLIASIGIGALVYFVIIYFMKIEEVDAIANAVKVKIKELLA